MRQAYEAFQEVYAGAGAEGVARSAASCAASLRSDPRILDYCLALDMFTEAVAAQSAANPAEARATLAAQALPQGADAAARVAATQGVVRAISLGEDPYAPAPPRPETPALLPVQPAHTPKAAPQGPAAKAPSTRVKAATAAARARARHAAARKPTAPAMSPAAARCAGLPSAADRIVCADPELSAADRRLRQALSAASAAAPDWYLLQQEQTRWDAERRATDDPSMLRELYDQRTRELEDETPPH